MSVKRHYDSVRLSEKWREGLGMPEQRYTIGESCALLDVDRVTLMRWLELENLKPQPDPRDKRYKYLTRDTLLTLARAHNRSIRDESTIGPRLTGFQRELRDRVVVLEEQVAALRAVVTRLLHVSPSDLPTFPPMPMPSLSAPASREAATMNEGAAQYPHNTEPSESPLSALQYRTYRPRGAFEGRLQPGEWATLPDIPAGWKSPREVAAELGVAERTFKHHLRPRRRGDGERYGSLDSHAGRWRYPHPGTFATELLDPEQQEAARRLFRRDGDAEG